MGILPCSNLGTIVSCEKSDGIFGGNTFIEAINCGMLDAAEGFRVTPYIEMKDDGDGFVWTSRAVVITVPPKK